MIKGKCFSACNKGQRRKSDFYQTPYSITEQLLKVEKFDYNKIVLEPCCGECAIVAILQKKWNNILNVNYYDKKWNEYISTKYDFLKHNYKQNYIITNPPFSLANEFILMAKNIYLEKIAFLLPLSYLHGQKRHELKIFNELARIYVFTRYPLLTDTIREDGKYNSGMIVYAWYIWEKGYKGKAQINWIDNNKYILKKND